jgi:hypothetical protein
LRGNKPSLATSAAVYSGPASDGEPFQRLDIRLDPNGESECTGFEYVIPAESAPNTGALTGSAALKQGGSVYTLTDPDCKSTPGSAKGSVTGGARSVRSGGEAAPMGRTRPDVEGHSGSAPIRHRLSSHGRSILGVLCVLEGVRGKPGAIAVACSLGRRDRGLRVLKGTRSGGPSHQPSAARSDDACTSRSTEE